jgi:hypothetical protein
MLSTPAQDDKADMRDVGQAGQATHSSAGELVIIMAHGCWHLLPRVMQHEQGLLSSF